MNTYRNLLAILERLILDVVRSPRGPDLDSTKDAEEIARVLLRSLGIRQAIQLIDLGEATPEMIVEQRARIHFSFGAPGDWGYETPIGATLAKLYGLDLSAKALAAEGVKP